MTDRQPQVQIDGIVYSLQSSGGISVYFSQLIGALRRSELSFEVTLYRDGLFFAEPEIIRRKARVLERYRAARASRWGVFHSSYYRIPDNRHVRTVVTVHDFVYEETRAGLPKWVHSAQKSAAIRKAAAIICVSEATKADLLRYVGVRKDQQVFTIPNGVSSEFRPLAPTAHSGRPFVLYVGDRRSPHKNFSLLVQAMSYLKDMELICVGGGPLKAIELNSVERSIRPRVRHLGTLSLAELNLVYNRAHCLAYPSIKEGFGIPILEAMRAGCPVTAVACAAVMEAGGEALTLAEPEPRALAEKILALADPDLRRDRILAGLQHAELFSWEKSHTRTLGIYRGLLELPDCVGDE